ncbi:RNA-binding transcriptional accessory protein [Psychrobium sp. MM17-31]|uniref:Tex family protein n=1 Tax=Psychrobium sp. MM17-31 TaxID=2917758 RepID=UPI001EF4ED08|nr:RNA-binding transcriptional accessory protein [Psychrobium sp. MM17-31]
MNKLSSIIAKKISISSEQANAAITLLDEGATVPFIARYRKEATKGLDDTQLRQLARELTYTRELTDRKNSILTTLSESGKLNAALKKSIEHCQSKTELEEIYKPFKSSRKTKGQQSIEAGLAPLAQQLLSANNASPQQLAAKFINGDIKNSTQALEGAAAIISEQIPQDIELIANIRQLMWRQGVISAKQARKKTPPVDPQIIAKFSDYFSHQEPINKIPSHRMMALLRGKNAGALQVNLGLAHEPVVHPCLELINQSLKINQRNRELATWLSDVAQQCWKLKVLPSVSNELISKAKESAETQAIEVFANNLSDLLMAAPAGNQVTLGLDPGIRTGVKVAVVDQQSKLLITDTIYPHAPRSQWQQSIDTLATLIKRHHITLVSIGNGTGSRETEKLVLDCKKQHQLAITTIIVSEAGASVYSASELAAHEFPTLDVSLRGAVSIARRLQDPLAELVKIEPKAIGVGQYQHDVNESQLNTRLDEIVEDCVNGVGVELNTASAPLLQRVSGLNSTLAANIVSYRESIGKFSNRKQLLKVPRLGPKAFEQAAGFLRIRDGQEPLDASAVHPESYSLANNIVKYCGESITELMGNEAKLNNLNAHDFTNAQVGLPTVIDVINELKRPARDPRGDFKAAKLLDGIDTINDLEIDMELEGTVTNVANFGAFVDIGVHQDGLVHISQLSDSFVSDPRKIVKVGQVVKVKVTEVDVARKRIALTMKSGNNHTVKTKQPVKSQQRHGSMADAFKSARKN